jgi:hypothetical protein
VRAVSGSSSNLPLKADGSLDYARLTLGQVCGDLIETLSDMVVNGFQEDLEPFLNDCPEPDELRIDAVPSGQLVEAMERLLRLEGTDTNFRSPEAREAVATAVRELRAQAAA